ncbi:MAG: bifunctional folylpolyglutamate synthase/dihydrofolate synthase [Candidatus Marinimicrobia bacterium]|nr:bifunctional folylpolyglutamate synthase/dihydrofolate synthase [Candidatus Neomarinimicrobiota bacterium]MCF7839664.1 bifunctional folylpolyglutamate synthase/dihydrofolate synthase [Candidatus Neomarinimicrobiota bacterium]
MSPPLPAYQEVIDYIFGLTVPGVKLELTRVEQFMEALGTPYRAYPTIHIAGTNGKGSTAAMLASVLAAAGMRVGLFTSPHLIRPNERIKVNGQEIPDQLIVERVTEWKPLIEAYGITFFEVLTALGFWYFKNQQVDVAVIETGLGGRLDATNVLTPILSVITSVDMDHMNILGNTIEAITAEKAGIIKRGVPVVLAENSQPVQAVIQKYARQENTELLYAPDYCDILQQEVRFPRQVLTCQTDVEEYRIDSPLLGIHQAQNVAVALAAISRFPFEISREAILIGMAKVRWPGRMQVIQTEPRVLYDVAHNPAGVRQLLQSLRYAGFGETVLLLGLNQRKDADGIMEILASWPGEIGLYAYQGESTVPLKKLLELQQLNLHITDVFENFTDGITWAEMVRSQHDRPAICIFGSHYLAEEIFPYYKVNSAVNNI